MKPTHYRTSCPIVGASNQETQEPTLDELLKSLHPEVRAGAESGLSFSFGGVSYTPHPPYRGRLRIFSSPGFPALVPPGCAMLEEQKRAVEEAVAARPLLASLAEPYRAAPEPTHLVQLPLEVQTSGPTVLVPAPASPVRSRALAAAFAAWALLALGALGWIAARHRVDSPVVAGPVCPPSTGDCR